MESVGFSFPKTGGNDIRVNDYESEYQLSRDKGFEEGLAEGYAAGYEKAIEETRGKLLVAGTKLQSRLNDLALASDDLAALLRDGLQKQLLLIVESTCRRVLRTELSQETAIIADIIRASLDSMAPSANVRLRMNEVEAKFISETAHSWGEAVVVTADANMPLGACIIETDDQLVELDLDKELAESLSIFSEELSRDTNS